MAVHERTFEIIARDGYLTSRLGAPMASLILAALAGDPTPHSGKDVRILALAGHDTNIAVMGGLFGLDWRLPGQPDGTSPAQTLAFELWSDRGRLFVRPVMLLRDVGSAA